MRQVRRPDEKYIDTLDLENLVGIVDGGVPAGQL
jgi:hypothetical protein